MIYLPDSGHKNCNKVDIKSNELCCGRLCDNFVPIIAMHLHFTINISIILLFVNKRKYIVIILWDDSNPFFLWYFITQVYHETWMYGLPWASSEYVHNLKKFLKVVEDRRVHRGECYIWCPCKMYQNCKKVYDLDVIEEYMIFEGFMNRYTC